MILLSVETSTEVMNLALLEEDRVLSELSVTPVVGASESLVPALDWLLGSRNITPRSLDRIACSTGPGSYTSLRAGFSFVRGLEASLDVPVVMVSPFDTLARQWSMLDDPSLLAVLNARQGQISAVLYIKDPDTGFFRVPSEPLPTILVNGAPSDPGEIASCLPPGPIRIVGPGSPFLLCRLLLPEKGKSREADRKGPRADCQGLVAWDRRNEPLVPPRLVYGRPPV